MTKEELEREYYGRRPTEPYSEDDSPNDWANIVHYAEENLGKAFMAIAKLEKENAELKQYAKALEETDNTNILHCMKVNGKLYKAKEIIKEMLSILSKENIGGIYEITEEAEQFLKEMKNDSF